MSRATACLLQAHATRLSQVFPLALRAALRWAKGQVVVLVRLTARGGVGATCETQGRHDTKHRHKPGAQRAACSGARTWGCGTAPPAQRAWWRSVRDSTAEQPHARPQRTLLAYSATGSPTSYRWSLRPSVWRSAAAGRWAASARAARARARPHIWAAHVWRASSWHHDPRPAPRLLVPLGLYARRPQIRREHACSFRPDVRIIRDGMIPSSHAQLRFICAHLNLSEIIRSSSANSWGRAEDCRTPKQKLTRRRQDSGPPPCHLMARRLDGAWPAG